jgi:beta-mannosidase
MFSSSAAIFWMFSDSWPVTHGWTIIDYYLRKKLAFHPVRRALEPVTVVVAHEGDSINVYGVNDAIYAWKGDVVFGYFGTRGGIPDSSRTAVELPATQSVKLASFPTAKLHQAGINDHGAFAVLQNQDGEPVARHKLFLARYKDLILEQPDVSMQRQGDKLKLSSEVFVWGLTFDPDGEKDLENDCIDLIPGIPTYINLSRGQKLPVIEFSGNQILNKKY